MKPISHVAVIIHPHYTFDYFNHPPRATQKKLPLTRANLAQMVADSDAYTERMFRSIAATNRFYKREIQRVKKNPNAILAMAF
ncbi:MAG: hypothetical protein V1722_03715 [Candidatus Micrarchaeota archaeon]